MQNWKGFLVKVDVIDVTPYYCYLIIMVMILSQSILNWKDCFLGSTKLVSLRLQPTGFRFATARGFNNLNSNNFVLDSKICD